jgi:hypothetical protein
MRRLAGIAFLLLQVAAAIHARFVPSRWLGAWAPNDYAVWYRLQVRVQDRPLSPDEVGQRYGIRAESVYENPPQNLMDIVRQREQTYGRDDNAQVVLTYHEDRGPTQEWRWPGI